MFPRILIIYHYTHEYPMRATIRDHLYSFRRYSGGRCWYVNLGMRKIPTRLLDTPFDLVVFHTSFLSQRWAGSEHFQRVLDEARTLNSVRAVKIALPQDEFIYCDDLCRFINDFRIDHVYSVAPKTEWPKIYAGVDFSRVRFHGVLTGYLEDNIVVGTRVRALGGDDRRIDIGYRAYQAPQWLGRHGHLKSVIAEVFKRRAPGHGLKVDISTSQEDTFLGNKWFDFLLRCKYFLGVEGGSTILDRDGLIRQRTDQYLASNPRAGFDEVEQACFPGADGGLQLMVISPRHLEACATGTCQVLVEGSYSGILRPGVHYVELKKDFSNLDEVIDAVKQDKSRREIVRNAYRDIVECGRYTNRAFVETVLRSSLGDFADRKPLSPSPGTRFSCWWTNAADRFAWARLAVRLGIVWPIMKGPLLRLRETLKRRLSPRAVSRVRALKRILGRP